VLRGSARGPRALDPPARLAPGKLSLARRAAVSLLRFTWGVLESASGKGLRRIRMPSAAPASAAVNAALVACCLIVDFREGRAKLLRSTVREPAEQRVLVPLI